MKMNIPLIIILFTCSRACPDLLLSFCCFFHLNWILFKVFPLVPNTTFHSHSCSTNLKRSAAVPCLHLPEKPFHVAVGRFWVLLAGLCSSWDTVTGLGLSQRLTPPEVQFSILHLLGGKSLLFSYLVLLCEILLGWIKELDVFNLSLFTSSSSSVPHILVQIIFYSIKIDTFLNEEWWRRCSSDDPHQIWSIVTVGRVQGDSIKPKLRVKLKFCLHSQVETTLCFIIICSWCNWLWQYETQQSNYRDQRCVWIEVRQGEKHERSVRDVPICY